MQIIPINKKFYWQLTDGARSENTIRQNSSFFSTDTAENTLIFLLGAALFCLMAFLTYEFVTLLSWLLRESLFSPLFSEMFCIPGK